MFTKYTTYMLLLKTSTKEDYEEGYAFVTKFYSTNFDPMAYSARLLA